MSPQKEALPDVICCNLDSQALTKFFNLLTKLFNLLTKLFNLLSEKAKISSFRAASPRNLAQTVNAAVAGESSQRNRGSFQASYYLT